MAVGDTLVCFFPCDNEPPASAYATLAYRNGHPVLQFDAAADESAVFTGVMPRHYANGSFTVTLYWAATSATSGTCRWLFFLEVMATLDLDTDSFVGSYSVGGTANATNGVMTLSTVSFPRAGVGSPSAGDVFRLKITRDADATTGPDDMVGDAELIAVELRES